MLVQQGDAKVTADPRWLANRSFVGQDASGHIIIGTSKDAFFSLDRLAVFLRDAPLGLTMALNLDGGPVACQGISIAGYGRAFCGGWETHAENGEIKLLPPLVGTRRWGLPNVIAVIPR
jgi:Phosphodiester glycosidase